MELPAGFTLHRTLGETEDSVSLLVEREGVLFVARTHTSSRNAARLRREFELLRSLDCPAAVAVVDLLQLKDRIFLIEEYIDLPALTQLVRRAPLELEEFLQAATAISSALADLHEHALHLSLHPDHIRYNRKTHEVRFVGFGRATRATNIEVRTANFGNAELPYIAPEQTGRLNQPVDARADLYALGVIFFELVSGKKPFEFSDALEMIHSHLARKPPVLAEMGVQRILSSIVDRLLAKTPDDRFASAHALAAAVGSCLRSVEQFGALPRELPEGAPDLFRIPDRLFGREQEMYRAEESLEFAAGGSSQLTVISGPAGSGKTEIGRQLQQATLRARGHFAYGRFDALKSPQPHTAIIMAMQQAVHELLSESETDLELVRNRLVSNAVVRPLLDVVPALRFLLPGESNEALVSSDDEERTRFNALMELWRLLCEERRPFVVFLDDVQFADRASLDLILEFYADPRLRHCLIAIAVRDEVDARAGLDRVLAEIRRRGYRYDEVDLPPLQVEEVTELVAATLQLETKDCERLGEAVLARTGGNPFFVREYLNTAHSQGVIFYDQEMGRWNWDLGRLQSMETTDNLAEMLGSHVHSLPEKTQSLLSLAACLGNRFYLDTLSEISERDEEETIHDLLPAINRGLILFSDDQARFIHERIRDICYERMSPQERSSAHARAAQVLRKGVSEDRLEARIFVITEHWNRAVDIVSDTERPEGARYNFMAARRAYRSGAYALAGDFASTALEILEPVRDQLDEEGLDLKAQLLILRGQSEYRIGDLLNSEDCGLSLLRQADRIEMRMAARELLVDVYRASGRQEAVLTTVQAAFYESDLPWPKADDPSGTPEADASLKRLIRLALPGVLKASPDHFRPLLNYVQHYESTAMVVAAQLLLNPDDMSTREAVLDAFEHTRDRRDRTRARLYDLITDPRSRYEDLARELEEFAHTGIKSSSVLSVADAIVYRTYMLVFRLGRLGDVADHIDRQLSALDSTPARITRFELTQLGKMLRALSGESPGEDLEEIMAALQREPLFHTDSSARFRLSSVAVMGYILVGRPELALTIVRDVSSLRANEGATWVAREFVFYARLAFAECEEDPGEGETLFEEHRQLLVQAMESKQIEEAVRSLEQALSMSGEGMHPREHALVRAIGGRVYARHKLVELARSLVAASRPVLKRYQLPVIAESDGADPGEDEEDTDFDLMSVLRASQALSGEIVLSKLLDRLLRILMETAGAGRAAFLSEQGGRLYVEADATLEEVTVRVMQFVPVEENTGIPYQIVYYSARTHETVYLEDARASDRFANDPVLRERNLRSILCLPVLNQGRLIGLVYLENDKIVGAFTPERRRVLEVLAAQGAISMHNAHMYLDLEEKVNERTSDLEKALTEVRALKEIQDGDYFLASLLAQPLAEIRLQSETVQVDSFLRQKKRFHYKRWNAEIGGDLNIAESITIDERRHTLFLNADAMGKSIQGSAGTLVLGSLLQSIVQRQQLFRGMASVPADTWLERVFREILQLFDTFRSYMMVTFVIGLIDDATGEMRYILADHPLPVLLREENATFVQPERTHTKPGMPRAAEQEITVERLELNPGDCLVFGTDGRDDILFGEDEQGRQIVNEDEDVFLEIARETRGNLEQVYDRLRSMGEIMDDLALLAIWYRSGDLS